MSAMTTQLWAINEKIVKEGDNGESLFIIKDGTVSCTQKGIELRQLTKGNFFGEQALLNHCVRTATITALTEVKIISIQRDAIIKVLGNDLEQILYRNTIRMSFEKSPVFKAFTEEQLKRTIDKMRIMNYENKEPVIMQGLAKGNHLWVVLKNKLKHGDQLIEPFTCIGDESLLLQDSSTFKETFEAESNSVVAEINKQEIEEILGGKIESIVSQNYMLPALKKVQVLRYLSKNKFQSVVKAFKLVKFAEGETIFFQNEPGEKFYIIKSGKVDIIKDKIIVRSINIHDYFGERSILFNDVRSATVVASSEVVCWVLERRDFLKIIDENIRDQLQKRIELQDDSITLLDLMPVKLLGKGMFGSVYLVAHKDKDTTYALKTVTRKKIAAYDIYDNILLERRILLQLDHSMIVKLIKTFKDNLRLYFLMEYVRGMDLFDVLTLMGRLNLKNGLFYTASLVIIIENLHERDIIYRDLKPENVMVDDEGYLKLIDFGTAKFIVGKTYTTVGTPHYMAPEIITGSGYNQLVDLWSLGIMVYEFFEGMLPFGEGEEDPHNVYEKILEHKLVFRQLSDCRHPIRDLIQRLLSVDPLARCQNDLKTHEAFGQVNFDKLISREIHPPHIPKLSPVVNEISRAKKARKSLEDYISKDEVYESSTHRAFKPKTHNWDDEF